MRIDLTTDYTTTDLVAQTAAEAQLKISSGYQSANVLTFLDAARQLVERDTDRSILNTTWTMKLDAFPSVIYLPKGVTVSVTSVKYTDTSGSEQTLSEGTDYTESLGFDTGRIVPVDSWPSDIDTDLKNAVEVIYVAGYGASSSTATSWAETAILAKISDLYEQSTNNKELYDMLVYKNRVFFDYSIND